MKLKYLGAGILLNMAHEIKLQEILAIREKRQKDFLMVLRIWIFIAPQFSANHLTYLHKTGEREDNCPPEVLSCSHF